MSVIGSPEQELAKDIEKLSAEFSDDLVLAYNNVLKKSRNLKVPDYDTTLLLSGGVTTILLLHITKYPKHICEAQWLGVKNYVEAEIAKKFKLKLTNEKTT